LAGSSQVKVTYSLPRELTESIRSLVAEGAAPSYSAFVEHALEAAVRRERERRLALLLSEAAADPLFLADIAEVEQDFSAADAEIEPADRG
jgi:Arc/MetJ-type ribon-helix-helix transcriptional regulator